MHGKIVKMIDFSVAPCSSNNRLQFDLEGLKMLNYALVGCSHE